MENKICPICEEGVLTLKEGRNETEYKGKREAVSFYYEECDVCGSEQVDAALAQKNKRLMIAFRKRVDGLLTGDEVRAIRRRLKLTQSGAARVFGGGPTAFSKYESDDITQSVAMDKLLRVADALPAAFRYLCRLANMEVPDSLPELKLIEDAENVVWHTLEPSLQGDHYGDVETQEIPIEGSYG